MTDDLQAARERLEQVARSEDLRAEVEMDCRRKGHAADHKTRALAIRLVLSALDRMEARALAAEGALVPREPTTRMLTDAGAMWGFMDGYQPNGMTPDQCHVEWWRAMWDAAALAREEGEGKGDG